MLSAFLICFFDLYNVSVCILVPCSEHFLLCETVDLWFVFFCGLVLTCHWQMAALCDRHSSCCERLANSAAAQPSSASFARSKYSRAHTAVNKCPKHCSCPRCLQKISLARHLRSEPGLLVAEEVEKIILIRV